jgi:hypothetical protein
MEYEYGNCRMFIPRQEATFQLLETAVRILGTSTGMSRCNAHGVPRITITCKRTALRIFGPFIKFMFFLVYFMTISIADIKQSRMME